MVIKKIMTEIEYFKDIAKGIETNNFFKMIKESSNRYTLSLGADIPKTFIKALLEEVLNGMGFRVEIKEDSTKITIFLKNLVL